MLSKPPKKIDHDFLTQHELLYRDTVRFEMKSENCHFPKSKLKDICFSTFKFYSLDEVEKNLPKAESIALKILVKRQDIVIKKAYKGNIVAITNALNI